MYDNADSIKLETLEELMRLLKDRRVSPYDLYAFAKAQDVVDEHEENREENERELGAEWTIADQLQTNWECSLEDGRDEVNDLYATVEVMLVKMGKTTRGGD